MMTDRSIWIAPAAESGVDVYGEYRQAFRYEAGQAELLISADSNYAVYINGVFVNSGQYPDFPYYKVYDRLDVTAHCRKGENLLCVRVWHYGKSNMGYYLGREMLRFELIAGEETLAASTTATESRRSRAYVNGFSKIITGQLGFSFKYDLRAEDDWLRGLCRQCCAGVFRAADSAPHSKNRHWRTAEYHLPQERGGRALSVRSRS